MGPETELDALLSDAAMELLAADLPTLAAAVTVARQRLSELHEDPACDASTPDLEWDQSVTTFLASATT